MSEMSTTITVSHQDIQNLLVYFSKNTYKAKEEDDTSKHAMRKCVELLKLDYSIAIIKNTDGELTAHYPSKLIFIEYENDRPTSKAESSDQPSMANYERNPATIYESMYDINKMRDLLGKAKYARCRARFPIPVIFYKGKHICRSSTLSGGPEMYGRSGLDYLWYGPESPSEDESASSNGPGSSDWQLFDRVRSQDIKLLKKFNVGTIIDFMVEKKKVKFGLNITSSEKVDKANRYSDFTIISLPYPGCEFFKEYRDNDYTAKGLVFNWSQAHVDANIRVPEDSIAKQLSIDWGKYQDWDLVKITQNYVKLLLKYLQENNTGLLIHCISGWDRTPLFVSLLRISLWADGQIHQSLDYQQMLYFTLAYDWMLFGHHLCDRLSKGEDILFFCFYMLKHLTDDEFSTLTSASNKTKSRLSDRFADKCVQRTDSDTLLECALEQDSCGSNISLNSCDSSISSKSQELYIPSIIALDDSTPIKSNQTMSFDTTCCSQASPKSRHTSPVSVPSPRIRQRQESPSSLSTGSWQMVTTTGSLRSSDSVSTSAGDSNGALSTRSDGLSSQESDTYIDHFKKRKERLLKLRALFYGTYCPTIGFKLKHNDSSISAMFGNFAGRVGF